MTAGECAARRVVLSEEDYHQLYSNPYSWANLVQVSLLMTYSCLFVGVSLAAYRNIRRLLDTCRALPIAHRHFAIIGAPTAGLTRGSHKLEEQLMRAHEFDLRSLGVEPIWIKDFIRLPANRVLQERIGHLLTHPVGLPPNEVRRSSANFTYQAGSWTTAASSPRSNGIQANFIRASASS